MNFINPLTNAALSTMWAINKYKDLNDFFIIARQMGFQKIELNHQVDSGMLSGVILDHYQFSSVHEPCPADISTKDLVKQDWLVSAHDENARQLGVEAVKKSIQLAAQVEAPVVVVHCGNVSTDMSQESKLRNLFKSGDSQSVEYLHLKSHLINTRQSQYEPRIKAVKKSLVELLEYSAKHDVKLGLENRYHFMDIPSIDEMEDLLSLADASQLGFIYDVGHAQALDRLGFYPHMEWLQRFSGRILGAHLHDVIGLTDHFAPGLGVMDFSIIAKYLPEDSFRTCEVLPANSLEQVEKGLKILAAAGCIKYL